MTIVEEITKLTGEWRSLTEKIAEEKKGQEDGG